MVKTDLLSTNDLVEMCNKMKINLIQCVSKSFLRIPPTRRVNSCYIINLDDTTGSHWTCIFVNKLNEAVYMDSYGQMPPTSVITFFKNNGIKWIYSTIQVQDYSSVLCGYFCIYFLFYMSLHNKTQVNSTRYAMNKILDIFDDDNQEKNDEILHGRMTELLKKYYYL